MAVVDDEREAFRAGWLAGHGIDNLMSVPGALLGYEERAWQRYVVQKLERDTHGQRP